MRANEYTKPLANITKRRISKGFARLGKLYLEENSPVTQDRLTGWRYLETLVDMNETENLSVADKARIKEAGELLGKLKFSPKHFNMTSVLAQQPKIRAFDDDKNL